MKVWWPAALGMYVEEPKDVDGCAQDKHKRRGKKEIGEEKRDRQERRRQIDRRGEDR